MTERVIATYHHDRPRPKRYRVEVLGRLGWRSVSDHRFSWEAKREAREWAESGVLAETYRVVDTRASER